MQPTRDPIALPVGKGEMSERTWVFDWSQTPLGPIETWPRALRTVVGVMLSSRYAMWLGWGPDLTFFYNDDYARMTLGPKHPWALGRPAREVWFEIWGDIGPRTESVVQTGQATWDEGLLLFLERQGFSEETYHTFSYSPVPDDQGGIGGMLCVVTEDTERTIGERRLRTLRELASRTADEPRSAEDACETAARLLAGNPKDLSFVLFYLLDADGRRLTLAGSTGVDRDSPICPIAIDLQDESGPWPFLSAAKGGGGGVVDGLSERFGPLPGGAWPEPSRQAVVLPLSRPGQSQAAGFVVVGVSPRRPFDDSYRVFFDLLAGQVATALANARAYEEERNRADKLAELDRAKTAFFSNVSHEFRTPLTLMLGPVEDILAKPDDQVLPENREVLKLVDRNGRRLLRLVNTLLDFSRIEAGRARALYRPTDLASLTADLASGFRSACERAGLTLSVDCPALAELVHVDPEMWEKVVLNLLSNAFKFTLEGKISVRLRLSEGAAVLQVQDTGTGIPAAEMPRLFERFHRVEDARGRTHEGSGIGLALVHDVVKLHGGSVSAESVLGQGTTFVVTIPTGSGHLPPDQIAPENEVVSRVKDARPYVEEAFRWLPEAEREANDLPERSSCDEIPIYSGSQPTNKADDNRPRVLLADDNADMRQYVRRLLSGTFQVDAVSDGEAALAAARDLPPDLILTDVMMPRLGGFGLLKALRADPRTAEIPVIMLSARAGEESRVEGLDAGADDYLVKPFGARELLARVTAHLQIARMRRESSATLRESEERLRMALTAARMVAWQWSPVDGSLQASENAAEVFGLPDGQFLESIAQGLALLHPDDLANYQAIFREAIEDRDTYLTRYRLIRPDDGRLLWMEERGHAVCDESGKVVRLVGVVMDITETMRIEEGLRNARSRLEATLAAGEVGTWEFNPVDDVVRADPNLARMFGVSPEEASGGPIAAYLRVVHPDDRVRVTTALGKSIAAGEDFEADYRLVAADGSCRWVVARGRVERDHEGRAIRLPGVVIDVTAQRRAEAELRASEKRRRLALDSAELGAWNVDAATHALTTDERFRVIFHGTDAPISFEQALAAIHADDRTRVQSGVAAALNADDPVPYSEEYRVIQPDGSMRWVFAEGRANFDPVESGGRLVSLDGTVADITDQKLREQQLRESEDRLRFALQAGRMGTWDLDIASGRLDCSETCKANYGRGPSESFTYEELAASIVEDDVTRWRQAVNDAAERADGLDLEYRTLWPDGSIHWVCVRASCVRDASGRAVSMSGVSFNIDERKRAEEALHDADRQKDEFLATLAHELRNPLAPIRHGLQIMKIAGDDRDVVDESRTLMERQVTHMVRLIDDLMDVSRISRGKMELRRERVELAAIVQNAVETSRPLLEKAGHELSVTLPARPILIDADVTRLSQVFSNLLNNSAKYTEGGGDIALVAERQGSDVVVSVRDNGVGIPAEMLPRVFAMFTQVDRSLERAQGGLGIGLSLVKTLVEMHGGSVEARSAGHGLGSEFIVRLPIVVTTPTDPPARIATEPAARSSPLRILVVDDNHDSARTLSRLLKLLGHEARMAHDGGAAIELAEAYRPELMLLDIGLPILNGYDVARAIRSRPWGGGLVIVALTGWGQEGDRRRSKEAGIDDHLVKPVDPALLERLLASLRPIDASHPAPKP